MRVASNNPICPVLDRAGVPFEPCYYDPTGTRIYEYPTVQGPAPPAEEVTLWEQAMNLLTVQREWADNAVSNTLYFKPKYKLVYWRDASTPKQEEWWSELVRQFDSIIARGFESWDGQGAYIVHVPDKYKITCKTNKYGTWEFAIYKFDPNHEENQIEKVLSMCVPELKSCSLLPHTAKGAYRQMPEEGITKEEYAWRKASIKSIDWSDFRGSDGEDEKFCQGETCVLPGAQSSSTG